MARIKYNHLIIIIIFSLFVVALYLFCYLQKERCVGADDNSIMNHYYEYETIKNENNRQRWINDTFGCWCMKSPQLADSLVYEYDLLHKSKKEVLTILGNPDEVEHSHNKLYLYYYFESVCERGQLIEGADKSRIEFVIVNDTLSEMPGFSFE